jgi:hypothetical protein
VDVSEDGGGGGSPIRWEGINTFINKLCLDKSLTFVCYLLNLYRFYKIVPLDNITVNPGVMKPS